jgi:multimeric flavodoxin WrbA
MIAILWASPNDGGLTAACVEAAKTGIAQAGYAFEAFKLTDLGLRACQQCGTGWGPCRNENECILLDGFAKVHHAVQRAQGLVVVTPVYWSEMAESAKNVLDRLRRCETMRQDASPLQGMPMLAIAAAGGSGNGTISTLQQMERFAQHVGLRLVDAIPVKRISSGYQLPAITGAARMLCDLIEQK